MTSQIALPLIPAGAGEPSSIVIGSGNRAVVEALAAPASWPFRTAILHGPPRAGKSLFARWFAAQQAGEAIDDAETLDETAIFHRWNRAQESGIP
ncbi:MAG TPA: ATPase, partial [Erythrobacter sp.]|nr:ATPase [Erythrobacter sp.]